MSKRNIPSPLLAQNMKSKKQKVDHNNLSDLAHIPFDEENYDLGQIVPSGFRFLPTEQELILDFLQKKVMNGQVKPNIITEVEVYKYNPEELSRQYRSCGEQEWYFFSPRDRRYPNGKRPNRSTQDGYWKATGKCHSILSIDGSIIGKWRTLVYYQGNHKNSRKTNWIMREYCLDGTTYVRKCSLDMKLDDWVLCRIYQNTKNYGNNSSHLPSRNDFQDEILNLNNDVWDFIDLDNLSTQDNIEDNDHNETQDELPSLVDTAASARTSPEVEYSRLIAEPFNNLYTVEGATTMNDIASYNNNEAIIVDNESMHPLNLNPPSSGFRNPNDQCYFQENLYWSTV